ncbi:MAG: M16 family metallopeptidase [Dongiaceae bacterium]
MSRKNTLRHACLLLLLILFTVADFAPAGARVFDPKTFTLANGIQVVVIENHRAPVATHMVFYRAGSADEQRGKTGIAHFLEHLMFKGTKTAPTGFFSDEIARRGGNENAFTTIDYTAYHQTIAVEHLAEMMRLEADRMVNLVLSDDVVLPERDVILEERRQRIDNDPSAKLSEMMRAALFLNHPYHNPTIGWANEIRQLTTEDALEWYRTWYAPNNAIVVISGDVTVDQVRALTEKYYGQIPARPLPERKRPDEPAQFAPRRVILESPQVQLPTWQRHIQAPSYHKGETKNAYALDVLAELLGGGSSSRLYRALVVDSKVATSAGCAYTSENLDYGVFALYGSTQPGGNIDALEAAFDAETARLLKDGVTEEEVSRAKAMMRADTVMARDSLFGPARIVGQSLATGATIEDIESWPDRIDAVTVEQVNQAARALFDSNYSVTAILLPGGDE